MNAPDLDAAEVALHELRNAISVFEYLNGVDVNGRLLAAYRGVYHEYNLFQETVKEVYNVNTYPATMWRTFMGQFMTRLASWVGNWVWDRLNELETLWTTVQGSAPDQTTYIQARSILAHVRLLKEQLAEVVQFDPSQFVFM